MNKNILFFLIVIILLYQSCANKSNIEGLWVVKLVKVVNQGMTPNARWTRFNSDSTQQSGNGWFQHSYGTWKFNEKSNN